MRIDEAEAVVAVVIPCLDEEAAIGGLVAALRGLGADVVIVVDGVSRGVRFTDMSPFRAIRRDQLEALGMTDKTYGWNLEMQMRAAARKLRICEVPVDCRRRMGGESKVSGNLQAALPAAWTIVRTFFRLAATLRRERVT